MDAVLKALQIFAQLSIARLGQRVDDPIFLPFGHDHSFSPQVGQVLGNLDLWLMKNFLKMTDAKGRPGQEIEDPQARAIAKALINLD